LHREVETRTFDRYCTHAAGVTTFVLSKVCLTFVILAVGCLILLGGGSLIFGFRWHDPAAVMALAAGVCLFSGGITAALNAWVGGGKKADVVNTMVGMALGMAGGCAFPARSLPSFLRDHVTPLLPPYWFVEAMRAAQFEGYRGPSWGVVALGLAALGLGFAVLAASRMRHQLSRGIRG
ncbi:MAG: ABC transporter permease, partial [Verrucomicrobiales bacterium]|nr:ABC transporter permease [Verrucomicrobiales bacterium]